MKWIFVSIFCFVFMDDEQFHRSRHQILLRFPLKITNENNLMTNHTDPSKISLLLLVFRKIHSAIWLGNTDELGSSQFTSNFSSLNIAALGLYAHISPLCIAISWCSVVLFESFEYIPHGRGKGICKEGDGTWEALAATTRRFGETRVPKSQPRQFLVVLS